MKVSVFTPSHDSKFLDDCYKSLLVQTYQDWEWVVLLNGDAQWSGVEDERVKVFRDPISTDKIGYYKRAAVQHCTGDLLVELDHDDMLAPQCLESIVEAAEKNPQAVLFYSDWAQMNEDGTPNLTRFDESMGWRYSVTETGFLRCHAMEPSAHNVSYIWYAPNHVRAFRMDAYLAVGGYSDGLRVLDDQDLMMRLYCHGWFHHIPEMLYYQRVHEANTQRDRETNDFIQRDTVNRYWGYYEQPDGYLLLAQAEAKRRGLPSLWLRTPTCPPVPQWYDGEVLEMWDATDLEPYYSDAYGIIYAQDLLQRMPYMENGGTRGLLGEVLAQCYRILVHGGPLITLTPSTDGRGAFQDPSHVSYWNENSFWYLTQKPHVDRLFLDTLRRLQINMRWQVGGIRTYEPTWFDREHQILYVKANLLAIKDGPRQGGRLES